MLHAFEPYLAELTPFLFGMLLFGFGLVFAIRERAASKSEKSPKEAERRTAA